MKVDTDFVSSHFNVSHNTVHIFLPHKKPEVKLRGTHFWDNTGDGGPFILGNLRLFSLLGCSILCFKAYSVENQENE
jgi:hypothetical protein